MFIVGLRLYFPVLIIILINFNTELTVGLLASHGFHKLSVYTPQLQHWLLVSLVVVPVRQLLLAVLPSINAIPGLFLNNARCSSLLVVVTSDENYVVDDLDDC